jgi:hypothetical protein
MTRNQVKIKVIAREIEAKPAVDCMFYVAGVKHAKVQSAKGKTITQETWDTFKNFKQKKFLYFDPANYHLETTKHHLKHGKGQI